MGRRKKKKSSGLMIVLIIAAVLVILCCAVLASGYVLLKYYYNNSRYVSDEQVTKDYDYIEHAINEGVLDEGDLATLSPEEEKELQAKFGNLAEISQADTSGTYSILLIGSDRRSDNWYGNSDAMILMTLNSNTKKMYMVSFMRDLYADIPGVGVRKLNAAHANGGGPLLVETIESNYGVSIDNYASVDFESMSEIVDMVGGVDIDVSADEARVANGYVDEICSLQGKNAADYYMQGGGICHLNGIQAVAYGRIRYVGNADYERTSRQREVLNAMIASARSLSISQLTELAKRMLPLVTHNLDEGTILNLIASIPDIIGYEVVTDRIPYDGLYYSSNELLIPNMEETIGRLQATIYAKE